jgi:hypothetical protein
LVYIVLRKTTQIFNKVESDFNDYSDSKLISTSKNLKPLQNIFAIKNKNVLKMSEMKIWQNSKNFYESSNSYMTIGHRTFIDKCGYVIVYLLNHYS